jgi:ABC-2 type transport system ATP-binding protein
MAIMNKGQVLLTGEPNAAIAELGDRVWKKSVDKADLARYEADFTVLSTRLVGGRPVIHVYSADAPEAGFEKVAPDLEDVYFQRLTQHKRQLAAAA